MDREVEETEVEDGVGKERETEVEDDSGQRGASRLRTEQRRK